jgi:predicted PhzF superfamily epimerase YddE/YHI9
VASREAVAAALGLNPMEIGFENHQPICFSAGLGFLFVPLRDLSAVARARAHAAAWPAAFEDQSKRRSSRPRMSFARRLDFECLRRWREQERVGHVLSNQVPATNFRCSLREIW